MRGPAAVGHQVLGDTALGSGHHVGEAGVDRCGPIGDLLAAEVPPSDGSGPEVVARNRIAVDAVIDEAGATGQDIDLEVLADRETAAAGETGSTETDAPGDEVEVDFALERTDCGESATDDGVVAGVGLHRCLDGVETSEDAVFRRGIDRSVGSEHQVVELLVVRGQDIEDGTFGGVLERSLSTGTSVELLHRALVGGTGDGLVEARHDGPVCGPVLGSTSIGAGVEHGLGGVDVGHDRSDGRSGLGASAVSTAVEEPDAGLDAGPERGQVDLGMSGSKGAGVAIPCRTPGICHVAEGVGAIEGNEGTEDAGIAVVGDDRDACLEGQLVVGGGGLVGAGGFLDHRRRSRGDFIAGGTLVDLGVAIVVLFVADHDSPFGEAGEVEGGGGGGLGVGGGGQKNQDAEAEHGRSFLVCPWGALGLPRMGG